MKNEFIEQLESIGACINTNTGMIYSMYKDGTYDPDSEIHVTEADHYEIQDYISDEDNEIYLSVLEQHQK